VHLVAEAVEPLEERVELAVVEVMTVGHPGNRNCEMALRARPAALAPAWRS
jgi:hypothetical protein